MTRFPDWPARMLAYIAEREHRRFKWGKREQDCCSFANGHVIAITGYDAMAEIRDYATADEADAILSEISIEAHFDKHFPRRPIGLAQRGDLALATLDEQDTLMVVEGATLVGPGRRGLVRVPRRVMRIAWAV